MSLFSLPFGFSRRNNTRRFRSTSSHAAEVLEVRRLLTNAAPELANLTTNNGEISADVVDDGSGGMIEIAFDYENDGSVEHYETVYEGDFITHDVSHLIPPNQTMPVGITLTEIPNSGNNQTLVRSYEVLAEGLSLAEVNIDSIAASPGEVSGSIDPLYEGAVGDLFVEYREVGSTQWSTGGSVDTYGNFYVSLPQADGQLDFEFRIRNEVDMWVLFGASETVYDVPPMSPPASGAGSGENSYGDDEDGMFEPPF